MQKQQTAADLLFEVGLMHAYTAEIQMHNNLDNMIKHASSAKLKGSFARHQEETKKQIERLEKAFEMLGIEISSSSSRQGERTSKELATILAGLKTSDHSKGMEGIISEGKEMIRHFASTEMGDLALIASAEKVENFEITCYNFLYQCAVKSNMTEIADMLAESLKEEKHALTQLAHLAKEDLSNL
ncbi:MAG: hypothetical protein K0S74_1528 [Chlamydiales bacterium]|jgi:ferritin-like metal-binding protein YciE|nr:hypothetical protein [Chlamydiales bacterium]